MSFSVKWCKKDRLSNNLFSIVRTNFTKSTCHLLSNNLASLIKSTEEMYLL